MKLVQVFVLPLSGGPFSLQRIPLSSNPVVFGTTSNIWLASVGSLELLGSEPTFIQKESEALLGALIFPVKVKSVTFVKLMPNNAMPPLGGCCTSTDCEM